MDKRIKALQRHADLQYFGPYTEEIISNPKVKLEELQAFEISQSSLSPDELDHLDKLFLDPPCFSDFQVPPIRGLPTPRQLAFEKPLFKEAKSLLEIIVPLGIASQSFAEDPELARRIINLLLIKTVDRFKEVNWRRVIAVHPDASTRTALSRQDDNILADPEVISSIKEAKTSANIFRPTKRDRRSRGQRRSQGWNIHPSPSSPISSSFHQPTTPPTSDINDPPPGNQSSTSSSSARSSTSPSSTSSSSTSRRPRGTSRR